jgi:tetratricopeptide (TPR) repeat protein
MKQRFQPATRSYWVFLLTSVVLAATTTASAQSSGNNPSSPNRTANTQHSIRGKIFMPSGNVPEQRLRVVLELATGGIAGESFSDSVGNFEFRGLASGTYRVKVPTDLRTYEESQESVELYGSFNRTFTVQIYLREKNNDNALRTNDKIISVAELQEVPKPAKKLYDQGLKLARNNKPAEAITKLQEALNLFPDYLHALNKLGEQQIALSQFAEAQTAFERAIAINTKYALPHINLGIVYFNQKRYDQAIAELETGNGHDDTYPMSHLNLGLALMSKPQPDYDRAEKSLLRAMEMGKPNLVYVRKYLFNLHVRRQLMDKAAAQLEAYLREAPDAPDAADVRQMLERVKKAIAQQRNQAKQP